MSEDVLKRPARKQVDEPVTAHEEQYATGTVNIWTGKRLREFRPEKQGRGTKIKSEYRCHPTLDEGWTKGIEMGSNYCCLYFARGICHHGSDCIYKHIVPTQQDEDRHRTDFGHDIFGRERRPDAMATKDVGSYSRVTTTLYVYLGGAANYPKERIEQLMKDNFAPWGPIDDIRVIPSKAIAFVRYVWRSSAEFAKAAMHQQTLANDIDTPLDVRWANDDPNPVAKERVQQEKEKAFTEAYLKAVMDRDPDNKRATLNKLQLDASYRPGAVAVAYPDTNAQYDDGAQQPEQQQEQDEEEDDDVEYNEEDLYFDPDEIEQDVNEPSKRAKIADEEPQQQQQPMKEPAAADDALGLLGGYGSD